MRRKPHGVFVFLDILDGFFFLRQFGQVAYLCPIWFFNIGVSSVIHFVVRAYPKLFSVL